MGDMGFAEIILVGSGAALPEWHWNAVAAVPEPESYALLLAGLGLLARCGKPVQHLIDCRYNRLRAIDFDVVMGVWHNPMASARRRCRGLLM